MIDDITSLLGLQSEHIADERTRGLFEEARNRVQAIAGIHDLLYRSPDLAHIDFGVYLNRLARDLFSFYGMREDSLHLAIHVNQTSLDISQAIPCGLIVNELVTNCLKHAFPGGRGGTITVSLDCSSATVPDAISIAPPHAPPAGRSQGQCILVVQDNGIGLPEGFDWEQTDSLGLQLVQVLTRQLEGGVRVDGTSGTRFEISFPYRLS